MHPSGEIDDYILYLLSETKTRTKKLVKTIVRRKFLAKQSRKRRALTVAWIQHVPINC